MISSFSDLLIAATQQEQPQRLLFVFASAELPDDVDATQAARFAAGQGGALAPLLCVDKLPDEVPDFASLRQESLQMGKAWKVLFVSSMSGRNGLPPPSTAAQAHLDAMVAAIKAGRVDGLLAFDGEGEMLKLDRQ